MSLKIEQGSNYKGNDLWKWWIWIEGPDTELDQIDHVVYTLHPTFPRPVRTVKTRENKFHLASEGWGTFTVYANVVNKDGTTKGMEHYLKLEYEDGRPAKA
jgi:transcription initiation factor IIF auxiliary subunit